MQNKTKSRWMLVGLLLCFILPMLLAHYYYRHPSILKGHTNRGQLLNPPLLLKDLALHTLSQEIFDPTILQKKWTMLYVSPAPCLEACQQNLYKMRQIRVATNKERERVNRLLVLVSKQALNKSERKAMKVIIGESYKGTLIAAISPKQSQTLTLQGKLAEVGVFYIVDPLGNIILRYPGDVNPEDLFKDLKHLLQVSQIG